MMGLLMPLGTYYVLTGELFSWEVFLISLPNAFMITAVLTGNETRDYHEDRRAGVGTLCETRDYHEDRRAGVGTLCGHLSYEGSIRLYYVMNSVGYPILLVLILTGQAPVGCALGFVALYDLQRLMVNARAAPTDPHASFMLVPMAFRQNWHFGVLLVVGYLLSNYLTVI